MSDLTFKTKNEISDFCSLVNAKYKKIIVGNSISKAFNVSSLRGGYGIIRDKKSR
jgi:histidinol-phosphate/aromatic aminotransferase/cobyric acid decarboxylase-like protein